MVVSASSDQAKQNLTALADWTPAAGVAVVDEGKKRKSDSKGGAKKKKK